MLLIELSIDRPKSYCHTYFVRLLILEAWEAYLSAYMEAENVKNNPDVDYSFIFYATDDANLIAKYYLPDSIVNGLQLENWKSIMPYWATCNFIPEEEKYKLPPVSSSGGSFSS